MSKPGVSHAEAARRNASMLRVAIPLYQQGMTIRQIADQVGLSKSRVHWLLQRHPDYEAHENNHRRSAERTRRDHRMDGTSKRAERARRRKIRAEEMLAMYDLGYRIVEIAETYGFTRQYVWREIRQADGYKPRKRGWPKGRKRVREGGAMAANDS